MKKTLIALAALAATGASFAQVTITGNVISGYQQTVSNAYTGLQTRDPVAVGTLNGIATLGLGTGGGARTTQQNGSSGFGVDTAEIFFTAKEDIGGGQSVEAKLGLENVSRGAAAPTAFGPADTTLTYTNTSFGRIQYGNTRGGAVFSGYPSAGAAVIDMDGKLFERRSASEYINYAVPIGPITVVAQMGEAAAGTGLGQGQSGTPTLVGQRSTMLLGLYREGPIEAFLAYKTYDNGNSTSIFGPAALTKDTQWSLQGSYDLGMAKVGFGYAYTRASVGATVADMLVGVNVPMGALEIGATFGQEIVSGIADVPAAALTNNGTNLKPILQVADGTATGWSIGAKYNLSKRTYLKANYAAWTTSGYAQFENFAAANAAASAAQANAALKAASGLAAGAPLMGYGSIETQANLLLSHSF